MRTNETNPQEYTDDSPIPKSEIGNFGTGTDGLKITATNQSYVTKEQSDAISRNTSHSLPKSSDVFRVAGQTDRRNGQNGGGLF